MEAVYQRLESSALPVTLAGLLPHYVDPGVWSSIAFRVGETEANSAAKAKASTAFLDAYSMEMRLDVIDIFESGKIDEYAVVPTGGIMTPERYTNGGKALSPPPTPNRKDTPARTVADIASTTDQKKTLRGTDGKEEDPAVRNPKPPLLLRKMSEHTYDFLRYGVFLPGNLILVPDEANLPKDLADSMSDHIFVVLHLQDSDSTPSGVVVVPLFKLVVRSEAKSPGSGLAPTFVLRAVYISSKDHVQRYVELAKADQHRAFVRSQSAAADRYYAPAPSAETVEAATTFSTLRLLWEECVVNSLPDHCPYVLPLNGNAHAPQAGLRMKNRLSVNKVSGSVVQDWTSGKELRVLDRVTDRTGPRKVHPSCRVVLRDTRSGRNSVEEAELCAYLPTDGECSQLSKYSTLAEERIRVWILKACLTAEVRGVHQLCFDLDTASVIAQCVDLLTMDTSKLAHGIEVPGVSAVSLHVLTIVLETIEDYLRHSGVVWRACVAVRDIHYEASATILRALMERKQSEELYEIAKRIAKASGDGLSDEDRALAVLLSTSPSGSPRRGEDQRLVRYNPPGPSQNVIVSASCSKVAITDNSLYELFMALDTNNDGTLSVEELTVLFQRKNSDMLPFSKRGTCVQPHQRKIMKRVNDEELLRKAELLAPLDACGLPAEVPQLRAFILQFSQEARAQAIAAASGKPKPAPPAAVAEPTPIRLTYDEFCVMMLAIARR